MLRANERKNKNKKSHSRWTGLQGEVEIHENDGGRQHGSGDVEELKARVAQLINLGAMTGYIRLT